MAKLNESVIMKALDWSYERAVNGIPGLDSAEELAQDYLNKGGSLVENVNSLIRWQNTKAAASGFITGLGGVMTLPVAVPANIATVLYVQVRMIAAIAIMGGYDVRDDRVKTLVFTCLCGDGALTLVKDIGIAVGKKLTEQAIKNLSKDVIIRINKAVGFRLLTKFGQTGIVNLGKAVPLLGGMIGATFDSVATNTIGNVARDIFIEKRAA
jgi:hypothetical protein